MTSGNRERCKAQSVTGRRFSLVPFREEDISDRYIGWLNDPEVNRFMEVRHHRQTRETVTEFVRSFYGDVEKYMWGVRVAESGECIGTATLYNIDRIHLTAELGLLIGEKSYWGSGAGREAVELVARFAFDELGLNRMTGGTYAEHHGMNFLYTSLGFRREGTQVKAFMLTPGKYADAYLWAILADEWKALHGEGRR